MTHPEKIGYHESSVTQLEQKDDKIIINVIDAFSDSGKKDALIVCSGVSSILIDNKAEPLKMFYNENEVLSLKMTENFLELIVSWHNFITRDFRTKSYKIECKKIDVTISEGTNEFPEEEQ